ncbi:UbiH/UbiF/VisC/COQ6 family ubiquinone biosynthesis hydroxylase [Frigidibacter sp. MR17.14]|uniref:UbiH/UbiF/VisC/COQ6 family ubiquinone biosynthesis hydroxylase n=1 Tax=Frigidibacter sp. MR17.14 TaxID=3126509 RepID=UPI0030131AF9
MDRDVLIVGGGLNGPALALALAQAGITSAVIDARPARARAEAGFDGRAYALALASVRLLAAIGIWPALADKAQPMLAVEAADARPGEAPAPFGLQFLSAEIEEGPLGQMVEDRHLYAAFLNAMAAAPAILHLPGATVTAQAIGPASATVTLADGRALTGRMIVGADGRASGTAQRAGITRTGWGYGQTALVAAIAHEHPHGGVARQVFLPGGPLAILPLTGNRSSIVWSETDANAARIAALDDAGFLEVLRPRFGTGLGEISLAGPRFNYPLGLTLADSYVADRLALVGDAAHGVHPIAGQGLNLGLRDVAALAETLADAHRRGEDIGAGNVLDRYQGWRRFDATTLALGMDGVNRLFATDNPLVRATRDLGMGLVQSIPALRRTFMRQAAGLAPSPGTRLPRLMDGRPL